MVREVVKSLDHSAADEDRNHRARGTGGEVAEERKTYERNEDQTNIEVGEKGRHLRIGLLQEREFGEI